MEQDIVGFNTALTCCGAYWAAVTGNTPIVRGTYNIDNKLRHVLDLISSAKAATHTLTFTIRKDANWDWGGRKLPVTYKDFVYTWQQLINPNNDVGSRAGYDQITGYTHVGAKQITFKWTKPYADWQDLFGVVYPSAALAGQDFNKIWTDCVCGSDGKPVSDGPFLMSNYTKGQGITLRRNPFWYGKKPGLNEVDFKIITDTNTEVQAMRGGEVDAINPTFGLNLLPLKGAPGIVFNQVPGLFQEHIDIEFGAKGHPLLKAPWFRHALMMGIDRPGIIKTVYGALAGDTKPLDSLVYYPADAAYHGDFSKWNYDPKKAVALLKQHCTGGPSVPSSDNSSIWTCAGYKASIRLTWTSSNNTRGTQAQILAAELKTIGIDVVAQPQPANVLFGPNGVPAGNYDLANFAWVTTPDPAGFVPIWSCGGLTNYLNYCNRKATRLMDASERELDPTKRASLFAAADKLFANDVPSIPLYARPNPLIWKSSISGMKNNPSLVGFSWNIEEWKWTS
jgi:peptide/nickel transport system substrate-binding protein